MACHQLAPGSERQGILQGRAEGFGAAWRWKLGPTPGEAFAHRNCAIRRLVSERSQPRSPGTSSAPAPSPNWVGFRIATEVCVIARDGLCSWCANPQWGADDDPVDGHVKVPSALVKFYVCVNLGEPFRVVGVA
jgi:hypothetical protein